MQTKYLYLSTSELRVRLTLLNRFKPSSKIFYWPFQGGSSFVDLLCFCSVLCLLCLCARLFICALWSPAGKGLTSWLSFVVSTVSFHFPIAILGQVWYLIVSIPDLCTLTYLYSNRDVTVTPFIYQWWKTGSVIYFLLEKGGLSYTWQC